MNTTLFRSVGFTRRAAAEGGGDAEKGPDVAVEEVKDGGTAAGAVGVSAADAVELFRRLLSGQSPPEAEKAKEEEEEPSTSRPSRLLNGRHVSFFLSPLLKNIFPPLFWGVPGVFPCFSLFGGGTELTDTPPLPPCCSSLRSSSPICAPYAPGKNDQQVCNLPDHPIHAGCTSVVAVMIGRTLVVANAGDSRSVLCRSGGRTVPLSFDHKPQQEREMSRIKGAGGFVNQFGRVNGNLNLSRSIGDLKYKQVPGIPPSMQMITAEPDVTL